MQPPTDVYDTLIPVYVLSKILGLAPFKLHLTPKRRGFKSQIGPVIIARLFLILGLMGFVADKIETMDFPETVSGIALRVELYLGTVMTGVVLICSVCNRKRVIGAVEDLAKLDKLLKQLDVKVSYGNAKKFATVQIIMITCVFLSKVVIQNFSNKLSLTLIYSVFNVVDYIDTIMLFQYVDLLLLVRQRYLWLNREIKALKNLLTITSFNTTTKLVKVYQNQPNINRLISSYGVLHNSLYSIGIAINKAYGLQILTTIVVRFVMVTTQMVFAYKLVQNPRYGGAVTYTLLVIYLLLHTSKLFMVASVSTNTSSKAKETGIYLHRLWESSGRNREEIMFFSLQVLHQEPNYTACGFVSLDYTLISGLVGAITTYLIIIIQFDYNSPRALITNLTIY